MIKYIFETHYYTAWLKKNHAKGANQKARNDIQKKALECGYRSISRIVVDRKGLTSLLDFLFLFKILRVKKNSLFLLQYPENMNMRNFRKVLNVLKKRNVKIAIWIHDLYGIRLNDSIRREQETQMFNNVDFIISHNLHMTQWLRNEYKINTKIVNLELFDYLCDYTNNDRKRTNDSVIIAGNLHAEKAGYLYKLVKYNPSLKFSLYGINYKEIQYPNVIYYGEYKSDELPKILNGRWGLIWDGISIESCDGNYGNYLRINNPHKMSLYMAAGLPVIVWTESALAEFVSKYNVGIIVNSLVDLSGKLASISEKQYMEMKNNALIQMKKVTKGFYSLKVLEKLNIYY